MAEVIRETKCLRVCRKCWKVFKVYQGQSRARRYCQDCRPLVKAEDVLTKILDS